MSRSEYTANLALAAYNAEIGIAPRGRLKIYKPAVKAGPVEMIVKVAAVVAAIAVIAYFVAL